ncbi:MAG TPA: nuclear transport factor 2 family protein [Solirubrobacteraceae bacterium]|nr:nuclear transport factor 2 family protein [Solirubrobacteraceae bacterium]
MHKRATALLCAPLLALGLSACAQTVSTSGLAGEAKAAGETVKDLQSNATAGEAKKICQDDLADAVVKRLAGASGGCQEAIKKQLAEIDSVELTVESIQVNGATATAHVKSVYSGKKRLSTMSLVKEGGKWRISSFS